METHQIQPRSCVKRTKVFFWSLSKPDFIPNAHFNQLVWPGLLLPSVPVFLRVILTSVISICPKPWEVWHYRKHPRTSSHHLQAAWALSDDRDEKRSTCYREILLKPTAAPVPIALMAEITRVACFLPSPADCEHAGQSDPELRSFLHLRDPKTKGFISDMPADRGFPVVPVQPTLTSGHHDVSWLHRGLDVLLKRRLHKLIVLFDDAADVPPTLGNVPLEPPDQTDVRVRVHKHLHVQQLADRKRNVSPRKC